MSSCPFDVDCFGLCINGIHDSIMEGQTIGVTPSQITKEFFPFKRSCGQHLCQYVSWFDLELGGKRLDVLFGLAGNADRVGSPLTHQRFPPVSTFAPS